MDNIINNRQEYNKRIVELLSILVDKYPELNFCGLLNVLEISQDNNLNEESEVTFNKIQNEYKILAQEKALDTIYPEEIQPKDVYEKVLEQGLTADIEEHFE